MIQRGGLRLTGFPRDAFFVALLAAVAFSVRSYGLVEQVFTADGVMLQSVDPWIHFREVQALTRDLTQHLDRDPYLIFPERTGVPVGPVFDTGAAIAVRMFFGPQATERQIATVCAVLPPVIAAMTIIIIFLLGRRLSGRLGGYVAAGVAAVCPSLFFRHSRLGAADHHVLEVFLSNLHILMLFAALGVGAMHKSCTASISRMRFSRVAFSLAGGLVLALYLWTWIGGVYWIALVTFGAMVQYGNRHLRGQPTQDLAEAYLPGILVAGGIVAFAPVSYPLQRLQIVGICYSAATIVLMHSLCWLLDRYRARRFWFPVILIGVAAAATVGWGMTHPQLFTQAKWLASRMWIHGPATAIVEVAPMFTKDGAFSLGPVWLMFSTGFPLALVGLANVMVRAFRRGGDGDILLTTWTLTNFIAMAGQNRFAYYASTNVALLVGIVLVRAVSSAGKRKHGGARWGRIAVASGTIALVFGPGLVSLPDRATEFDGPSTGFMEALLWMRRDTPEPFGDPAVYWFPDRANQPDAAGQAQPYGVLSSWDSGYWITAIARRIPCSNPTQAGAGRSGGFFTSYHLAESAQIVRDSGAHYVLLDSTMVAKPLSREPDLGSKFYSMAQWADRPLQQYYEWFEITGADGEWRSVPLFYPTYFRSMAVRLYAFGGQAIRASRPIVIRYENITDDGGAKVKRVVEKIECDTYDQAIELLRTIGATSAALVSDDPFKSCIPLEQLHDYRSVFDSHWLRVFRDGTLRPDVRVFEYNGR